MIIYALLLVIYLIDYHLLGGRNLNLLVIATTIYAALHLLRGLTKKVVLPEAVALIGCFNYLVMPLIVYRIFNERNYLARIYETAMELGEQDYYSLAFPGTILLAIGLQLSLIRKKNSDINILKRCKMYLHNRKWLGYLLIIMGFAGSLMLTSGSVFSSIFYFQSQLTFIGILYLLHSPIRAKTFFSITALALLIFQSAMTAMFGELVLWSIFGVMILVLNRRIAFAWRVAFIMVGMVVVLWIQSFKHEYRQVMASGYDKGAKPSVMFDLAAKKILKPEELFSQRSFFGITIRVNQGFLVARTMNYVPRYEPFAKGETIWTSLAAAVAPRIIWKDKPMVGGKEMVCRFLGDCQNLKYSYNIGQLGEGYVNFGVTGGAIFMFFYGLLIRTLMVINLNLTIRHPTLLLWVPLFFFSAPSLETDFLTFINSIIKAAIFAMAVFFFFRFFLRIRL